MIEYTTGICSDNADIAQLQKKTGKQAKKINSRSYCDDPWFC